MGWNAAYARHEAAFPPVRKRRHKLHRTEQSVKESGDETGSRLEEPVAREAAVRPTAVRSSNPPEGASVRPDFIYHRLLATSDVLAIVLAALAAYAVADASGRAPAAGEFFIAVAAMTPVWLAVAYFAGLYHQIDYRVGQDFVDEFGTVIVAITAWTWLLVVFRSVATEPDSGMTALILLWVTAMATLLLFRALLRFWARRQGWNRRSIALVGDREEAAALAGRIDRHPEWCLDVRASVQPDPDDPALYVVGNFEHGADLVREEEMIERLQSQGIDRAVVVGGSESLSARSVLFRKLANEGIAIDHVVGGPETLYSTAYPQHLEGITVLSMRPSNQPRGTRALKRTLDVVLAAVLLLLTLPVLGISALAIKFTSSGPVFFRQQRAGKDGETFSFLKLRTMCADADAQRDELRGRHVDLERFELFKLEDDPRITRVGRHLRRWSIDEIPQLWNVLVGDMSLVGPRPLPLDEAPLVVDEFKLRERVRPGMTGPWQVMGRSDIPAEDMLKLDYTYVIGWTFTEDLKILMRTAAAVVAGRGVK